MPAFIDNMIYKGEQPWHKQGTLITEKINSIEEAVELAKLNWTVTKEPVYYYPAGIEKPYNIAKTGHYVTVRSDTKKVLGHVTGRYTILQNLDAFQPFEPLLERGYEIETAGSTQDGKRVWMLAKAPEEFRVYDDKVLMYLLLYTSHDGSAGSCMRPTGVRVVCDNTIDIAIAKESMYNYQIKHTNSISERITDLTNNVREARGNFKKAINDMERLADYDINPDELDLYFESVIPFLKDRDKKNIPEMGIFTRNTAKPVYEKLVDNFYNGRGNNGETLWDAYNAITEYYTHDKKYNDWVKQTQFGQAYTYKVKALKIANMIAKNKATAYIDAGLPN